MKNNKIQFLSATLNILLVALALWSIKFLIQETNFKYYSFLFAHLSPQIILFRYIFSISLRIILMISCIGAIFRKKAFKFILISYAAFTILTIYWKHPYSTFEKIYDTILARGDVPASMIDSLPLLTSILVIKNCLVDIGISLLLILLLTNKKLSRQFT